MPKKIIILPIILISAAAVILVCRRFPEKKSGPVEMITLSDAQFEPFFNIRGWDVEKSSDQTVRLPESFDGVFANHAKALERCGSGIEKYKGKEVRRVLFLVKNAENGSAWAELLLDNENLLGASVIINGETLPIA